MKTAKRFVWILYKKELAEKLPNLPHIVYHELEVEDYDFIV